VRGASFVIIGAFGTLKITAPLPSNEVIEIP